jgi:RNA-binding protein
MGLVEDLSPDFTGKQRRHLRSLAHELKPLVMVGQRGISENLIQNLDEQLLAHELVKVKVHDSDAMEETAKALAEGTGAALIQTIGKMLVFYRRHPEKPTIKIPG